MRDHAAPAGPEMSQPHKLLSIQVLRAVAALCVVVHHAGYDADTLALRFGAAPLRLDRFFDWTFGVHLFFVISGFIMVRTARGFGTRGAPLRFFGRRILRVVPLYWLMTSLVLLGAVLAPALLNVPVEGWGLAVGSYLFIPVTRINGEIRPILGQGWTLNYEMFFYCAFAAAMALPQRLGLGMLSFGLVALVVAGRLTHPETPALMVWTDGLLLEFLLGVGIGLAVEAGLRLTRPATLLLTTAALGLAVLLGPATGFATGLGPWVDSGVPAAMILGACASGPAWRPTPVVLGAAAIGDASYSLYLTHPFAIRLLRVGWASAIGTGAALFLFPIVAVAAAIGVSLAVFRSVERPLTARLQQRFPLTDQFAAKAAASTHRAP